MDSSSIEVIKAGLYNGFGFTSGCEIAGVSPEVASEYIRTNELIIEMRGFVFDGKKKLLLAINKAYNANKIAEWKSLKSELEGFIGELYLWESICPRHSFSIDLGVSSLMKIKNVKEVATGMGCSYDEFLMMISNDKSAYLFLHDHNLIQ